MRCLLFVLQNAAIRTVDGKSTKVLLWFPRSAWKPIPEPNTGMMLNGHVNASLHLRLTSGGQGSTQQRRNKKAVRLQGR